MHWPNLLYKTIHYTCICMNMCGMCGECSLCVAWEGEGIHGGDGAFYVQHK